MDSEEEVYTIDNECPECGEVQDEPPGGWLDGEELACSFDACGVELRVMQDDNERAVYLSRVDCD